MGGNGFFPSFADLVSSENGVFRIDAYSREAPDRPRLSVEGRFTGGDYNQDNFAGSARWLANRFVFFRADMRRNLYCVCDMEKR